MDVLGRGIPRGGLAGLVASGADGHTNPSTIAVVDITPDEFEALVVEAMDGVPEPFRSAMKEVAVVIEERSPAHMGTLFGLYQGVPLTHGSHPSGFLPPQISIYVHPMVDVFHTRADLIEQVRITVLHELGHHLGMDEDQLEELGYG